MSMFEGITMTAQSQSSKAWMSVGVENVNSEMIEVTSFADNARKFIRGKSNERHEETVVEIPAIKYRCSYCGRKAHGEDATCDGCGAPL